MDRATGGFAPGKRPPGDSTPHQLMIPARDHAAGLTI
jgi:hypothetical protein